MFLFAPLTIDQAKHDLKPRPNGKCLAIKHDQTLLSDQTFSVWTPCLIVFDKI